MTRQILAKSVIFWSYFDELIHQLMTAEAHIVNHGMMGSKAPGVWDYRYLGLYALSLPSSCDPLDNPLNHDQ